MYAARALHRAGFTLIEILVTLVLLSLLVAAVFPSVTQQLGQADAPRMANDLVSIRSGIATFNANLRRGFPGDLEDLVFAPVRGGDQTLDGTDYLDSQEQIDARWNGPYADLTIPENTSSPSGSVLETGYSALVDNQLTCYDAADASTTGAADQGTACASGDFVAVRINGLTHAEFVKVNELLDGSSETTSSTRFGLGKLRCAVVSADCAPAYYLAVPYRP